MLFCNVNIIYECENWLPAQLHPDKFAVYYQLRNT